MIFTVKLRPRGQGNWVLDKRKCSFGGFTYLDRVLSCSTKENDSKSQERAQVLGKWGNHPCLWTGAWALELCLESTCSFDQLPLCFILFLTERGTAKSLPHRVGWLLTKFCLPVFTEILSSSTRQMVVVCLSSVSCLVHVDEEIQGMTLL